MLDWRGLTPHLHRWGTKAGTKAPPVRLRSYTPCGVTLDVQYTQWSIENEVVLLIYMYQYQRQ